MTSLERLLHKQYISDPARGIRRLLKLSAGIIDPRIKKQLMVGQVNISWGYLSSKDQNIAEKVKTKLNLEEYITARFESRLARKRSRVSWEQSRWVRVSILDNDTPHIASAMADGSFSGTKWRYTAETDKLEKFLRPFELYEFMLRRKAARLYEKLYTVENHYTTKQKEIASSKQHALNAWGPPPWHVPFDEMLNQYF